MIKMQLGRVKRYLYNMVDNAAIVLLYHRVIDLQSDPQMLAVSPELFYEQIKFAKEHYNLLTIEQFYEIISQKKRFPKNSLILTFDDGYADNLHYALPILEDLSVQALFYISTSKIGTQTEFWWDDLERIILLPPKIPGKLSIKIKSHVYNFSTNTKAGKTETYNRLHVLLKYCKPVERDAAIKELQSWAGVGSIGRDNYRVMYETEIKKMQQSPSAIIGAHTHNHPALSALPYEEQLAEMKQSKTILETLTGNTVDHFSYPYGYKTDFNNDSILAAKSAGFKMVTANYYGHVHQWTQPYKVPRILVRNWQRQAFISQIRQFYKN